MKTFKITYLTTCGTECWAWIKGYDAEDAEQNLIDTFGDEWEETLEIVEAPSSCIDFDKV